MHLPNSQQKLAIVHAGSPLLVLAGAGSGKTRVITEKIARLVKHENVPPGMISAVTFTNKAAREMKARVSALFENSDGDKNAIKGLSVSTFHSLGMRILRSNLELAGLRQGFSIIDPVDSLVIIGDLLAEELARNINIAERVQRTISGWKNDGIIASAASASKSMEQPCPASIAAAAIYPRYDRYLRACNSVDLDDLIFLPTQLFKTDNTMRTLWQEKIRYLLVDEYQDTNGAQYELVRQLVGDGSRLTVVGDDDQSIYSWRGARPENLGRLGQDFPDLAVIKLEQNYRSAGRILKVANGLIANNPRPFSKTLWSELGYGDAINIARARDDDAEAEKVVSAIMTRQFRHNESCRDFAILYRSNHQARIIEIKLRELRIPYRVSGGLSFFDRSEVRDIVAYLRLITNNADDTAFLRVINTPRRGIGASTLEKISSLAAQRKQSLLDTLLDHELATLVNSRQLKTLQSFAQRLVEFGDIAERGDPVSAVKTLLEDIGYERWLVDSGDEKSAQRRWENVTSLVNWIESLAEDQADDEGLSDIISRVVLNDILHRQRDDDDQDLVSLMTLHASKGLEFKHVFIVGVEEEILPHRVSIMDDAIEEERRLFYVGITRAMRTLSLSYCQIRKRYGETVGCDPGRFLEELPVDEIEWEGQREVSAQEQHESGRSQLALIRAGLSSGRNA